MRRVTVIVAAIVGWLAMHSAAPAQNSTAAPNHTTALEQRAEQAEERSRTDRLDLAVRLAADELEDAQTEQAYNRFEVWMGALVGFFSILITFLIIFFGIRTARAAATEAAAAAQKELAGAKGQIEDLLAQARAATEAAEVTARTSKELLATARENLDALEEKAKAATERAEARAVQTDEAFEKVRRGAEAVARAAERVHSGATEAGTGRVTLTEDEAAAVRAGADAMQPASEAEWSADDFKVQVAKAAYIDHDYEEALRLAVLMEAYHSKDDASVCFALRAQGDALLELRRYERAIGAYDDLIQRFRELGNNEIAAEVSWAQHHMGVALTYAGRSVEAEAAFRGAIESAERLFGGTEYNTLSARQGYAAALLGQGRGAEAELLTRELLDAISNPLLQGGSLEASTRFSLGRALILQDRASAAVTELQASLEITEKHFGNNHANTLTTKAFLARAMFFAGDAVSAVDQLREILSVAEQSGPHDPSVSRNASATLAEALLELGKVDEAELLLNTIHEDSNPPVVTGWSAGTLAFARARVAEARKNGPQAAHWLELARSHVAAAHPAGSFERQRIDTYTLAKM